MKKVSPLSSVASLIEVYRAAQRERPDAFAKKAFAWLGDQVKLDQSVIVTSLRGATWVDAHFHGIADPRALMEGHERVRHLDPVSEKMFAQPMVVHRDAHDGPANAAKAQAPFRAHLKKNGCRYILIIGVPNERDQTLTVLMVVRGWASKLRDFDDHEVAIFQAIAAHVVEAFAVNRTTFLGTAAGPGAAPGQAPPVASIDAEGRFTSTMPAFQRLFWPEEPPATAYLPAPILKRLRRGLPWPLPTGGHTLHAYEEESGGYLLRLRTKSPAVSLSARERQIAVLFARGATYKAIAADLSLSPITVRNHLQNLYGKLGVTQRDELHALLSRP
jgi:DNA-binding CsgD family transcriptional regulator